MSELIPFSIMSFKIIILKLLPHLLAANDFLWCMFYPCHYWVENSVGNSHRSAGLRLTTLEEDREFFVDFSLILYLWFEIQGMRTYNFFDRDSNTVNNTKLNCTNTPITYETAPSHRLSASARRRALSRSNTPQVAWSAESSRQSPAVRFHSAYSRLPSRSLNSALQLRIGSCTSSSGTNSVSP